MYLGIKTTKKHRYFYVMERVHADGKPKNVVIEALGREDKLRCDHEDPEGWARTYIKELNDRKKQNPEVTISLKPSAEMPIQDRKTLNIGYLFLQRIYNDLRLPEICAAISRRWHLSYNLNSILSRLVYCRILFPNSEHSVTEDADRLLQKRDFDHQDLCRAARLFSSDTDWIQSRLYRSRSRMPAAAKDTLWFSLTNICWDYPQTNISGHRSACETGGRPGIVSLNLFFDSSGIPLACSFWPAGTSQITPLRPFEKELIENFGPDNLIVTAEAGMYPEALLRIRDIPKSAKLQYITGQPLHELSSNVRKWALSENGWHPASASGNETCSLCEAAGRPGQYTDRIFYKERPVKELSGPNDDRLIALFFPEQYAAQSMLRRRLADGTADKGEPCLPEHRSAPKGQKSSANSDREPFCMNPADGFNVVRTNLKDPASILTRLCAIRWNIKDSFRLYPEEMTISALAGLPWEDEIRAHFLVAYIAFLIQRALEAHLRAAGFAVFTMQDILDTLRQMYILSLKDVYVPVYTRTPLTQALEHTFGIPVHHEVYDRDLIRMLCRKSKGS